MLGAVRQTTMESAGVRRERLEGYLFSASDLDISSMTAFILHGEATCTKREFS